MADFFSKKDRSRAMSKIRNKDTLPEMVLRCGLHILGFRFRLENKSLSGCPDLVFPKYKAVVFVHGCYWHRHPGCKDASMPKSNIDFWSKKFDENVQRDGKSKSDLEKEGWRVLVVWECELTRRTVETISKVAEWLDPETAFGQYHRLVEYGISRDKLLAIAGKKVKRRLASYKDGSEADVSGSKGE